MALDIWFMRSLTHNDTCAHGKANRRKTCKESVRKVTPKTSDESQKCSRGGGVYFAFNKASVNVLAVTRQKEFIY